MPQYKRERAELLPRERQQEGAERAVSGAPAGAPETEDRIVAVSPHAHLTDELVDELLGSYERPEDLTGQGGLLAQLTKRLVERVMHAELDDHLGYEKGAPAGLGEGNTRNGTTPKTLLTDHGKVAISRPRDRDGSFEPQIVGKHQRRFSGFDDKIISLYARGMTVRDIQRHLAEIYHVEVGHDLVSRATDAVIEDVRAWQSRPLEPVYAIVYLDAMSVKIRTAGAVHRKMVYLVMGVTPDGEREVLGIWIQKTEGAKFWLQVLTELKNRGVKDILISCVDGLKGFPEAIEATFEQTVVQTCIVHLIRASLRHVSYKDRRAAAAALKLIYTAPTAEAALDALEAFEETWNQSHPSIAKSWRDAWEHVTPFLAFPPEVRRAIYTTNAIEALNRQIRKAIKTRGHFPNDEAALKLIYLAIDNAEKSFKGVYAWSKIYQAFSIHFEDRLPTID
jgi:putative transposase